MSDLIPPHDLDAEKSYLGAMMLSPNVDEDVKPDDFYRETHSLIFRAICALRGRHEPADVVAVASELGEGLERVGGRGYLLDILNSCPLAGNAPKYAAIIREASRKRAVIEAATCTMAEAYSDDPADEVESRAFLRMGALQRPDKHASESLRSLIDREMEALKTKQDTVSLPSFDRIQHAPGELIILGARPKHGKSAFGAQVALDWSLEKRTAFYSYEMSSSQIVRRIISRFSGVSTTDLARGMDESDVRLANSFMENARIEERDFSLKNAAGLTPRQLFASMRRFAAGGGQVVVLDYIQLAARARAGTLREDVTVFSNELKQVLLDTGLTCLALSQLRRPDDAHVLVAPSASALRESGSLEQDADAVYLMQTLPEFTDAEYGEKAVDFANKRLAAYDLTPSELTDGKRLTFIEAELVRSGEPARRPFVFDGAAMLFSPVPRRF